jgi:hypothetical protein
VPWCEECAKYYTPNSVNEDGSCPACGEALQLPEGAEEEASTDDESTPWHFKLMVVAVVAYLGWRLIQLFA